MRWKRSVSVQDGEWEDDCAWTSARVLMGIQMGMLLLCNKINCWTEKTVLMSADSWIPLIISKVIKMTSSD